MIRQSDIITPETAGTLAGLFLERVRRRFTWVFTTGGGSDGNFTAALGVPTLDGLGMLVYQATVSLVAGTHSVKVEYYERGGSAVAQVSWANVVVDLEARTVEKAGKPADVENASVDTRVKPQGKLVRVIAGEVFDVAVDIRKSSPTFGQWFGTLLSAENKRQMWIPPGFAHGFLVLSESAEFLYKTTDYWAPQHERWLGEWARRACYGASVRFLIRGI